MDETYSSSQILDMKSLTWPLGFDDHASYDLFTTFPTDPLPLTPEFLSSNSSPYLFPCTYSYSKPTLREAPISQVDATWTSFPSSTMSPIGLTSSATTVIGSNHGFEKDLPTFSDFEFLWTEDVGAYRALPEVEIPSSTPTTSPTHVVPASLTQLQPQPQPDTQIQPRTKGVMGWGDTSHLRLLPTTTTTTTTSVQASVPPFANVGADICAVLDPRPLASLENDSDAITTPLRKRLRTPTSHSNTPTRAIKSPGMNSERTWSGSCPEDDEEEYDDSDADDDDSGDEYQPSLGPDSPKMESKHSNLKYSTHSSLSPSNRSSSPSSPIVTSTTKSMSKPKPKAHSRKSKKDIKRGSAALALAVVTEIHQVKRKTESDSTGQNQNLDSLDPVKVYRNGGTYRDIKKRKNQPIPVPVPIPNLNKNSRGRKVPFVASNSGRDEECLDSTSSLNLTATPRERRSLVEYNINLCSSAMAPRSLRTVTTTKKQLHNLLGSDTDVSGGGGGRTFVCVAPGCGKCFVRGEHLKRHVRSIHTHDKPHVCPYEGCSKSFSRRDNLGQHVRIHLYS